MCYNCIMYEKITSITLNGRGMFSFYIPIYFILFLFMQCVYVYNIRSIAFDRNRSNNQSEKVLKLNKLRINTENIKI